MSKILKLVYHDTQNCKSYHDMKFTIMIYDILSPIAHHYYVHIYLTYICRARMCICVLCVRLHSYTHMQVCVCVCVRVCMYMCV